MQTTDEIKALLSKNNVPFFVRITGGKTLGRCYYGTTFEVWKKYSEIKDRDWESLSKFLPSGQESYFRGNRREGDYFVYSCEVRTDSSD